MEFLNEVCKSKFEQDLQKRSITHCMTVDFSGWESLKIKEMFDSIGLHKVYALKGYSCEKIVRLFYANLTAIERNGVLTGLTTYILGKQLIIGPETVNGVLEFAMEGVEQYYHASKKCPFFTLPEGVEFLRGIHINPNIGVFVKPRTRDLNVRGRVLRNMLAHTLLPRDGHRHLVSCMDLYVMEKLCNKKPFDPGFLILSHMHEIGRASTTNLSYGTLIMKIIERARIQLPVGEQITAPRSDVFNMTHLSRMGLVEIDGVWALKSNQEASTTRAVLMEENILPPLAPQEEDDSPWDMSQYLQHMYEMQHANHQKMYEMQQANHLKMYELEQAHHQELYQMHQTEQQHLQHIIEIQQRQLREIQLLVDRVDEQDARRRRRWRRRRRQRRGDEDVV